MSPFIIPVPTIAEGSGIRVAYVMDDVQHVFYTLLSALCASTAPWTSWAVVKAFPNVEILETFSRPVLYVTAPERLGEMRQQAGLDVSRWRVTVGAWDDAKTGGPREINVILSQLYGFFRQPACHRYAFDCVLGGDTYEATCLLAQGIKIEYVDGPRMLMTVSDNEWRGEIDLVVNVFGG